MRITKISNKQILFIFGAKIIAKNTYAGMAGIVFQRGHKEVGDILVSSGWFAEPAMRKIKTMRMARDVLEKQSKNISSTTSL